MHNLIRVISGGQTGADQAGLFAAERFGIPTGGWAPRGWMTARGSQPMLLHDRFNLQEHRGGYAPRTAANVSDSDGTMRFAYTFKSHGELCTFRALVDQKKPYFDIDLTAPPPIGMAINWLIEHDIHILNIAGNREPDHRLSVFIPTHSYLVRLFTALGHPDREVAKHFQR